MCQIEWIAFLGFKNFVRWIKLFSISVATPDPTPNYLTSEGQFSGWLLDLLKDRLGTKKEERRRSRLYCHLRLRSLSVIQFQWMGSEVLHFFLPNVSSWPNCPRLSRVSSVDTEYCGGQLTRWAVTVCHCVAAQTCNYLQVNCSILQHVGLGWARANFILGSTVQLYTDNRTSSGGTRGKLIWQTTVSMGPSYQEPADGIRPRLVIICCIWTW